MQTIEIAYKYVPFGVEFEHNEQKYIKTNFDRGYYMKDGKKVFRGFRKSTIVKTSSEYFDVIQK